MDRRPPASRRPPEHELTGFFGTDKIGWTITRADIAPSSPVSSTTSATSTPHQRSAAEQSPQWSPRYGQAVNPTEG
jgi:hypothetical protein